MAVKDEVRVAYMSASGVAFSGPAYVRLMMLTASLGSGGVVQFYNQTTAPVEGDVPVGQFEAVTKGTLTVPVPEPGVLFTKGAYVVMPGDTTMNLFYTATE